MRAPTRSVLQVPDVLPARHFVTRLTVGEGASADRIGFRGPIAVLVPDGHRDPRDPQRVVVSAALDVPDVSTWMSEPAGRPASIAGGPGVVRAVENQSVAPCHAVQGHEVRWVTGTSVVTACGDISEDELGRLAAAVRVKGVAIEVQRVDGWEVLASLDGRWWQRRDVVSASVSVLIDPFGTRRIYDLTVAPAVDGIDLVAIATMTDDPAGLAAYEFSAGFDESIVGATRMPIGERTGWVGAVDLATVAAVIPGDEGAVVIAAAQYGNDGLETPPNLDVLLALAGSLRGIDPDDVDALRGRWWNDYVDARIADASLPSSPVPVVWTTERGEERAMAQVQRSVPPYESVAPASDNVTVTLFGPGENQVNAGMGADVTGGLAVHVVQHPPWRLDPAPGPDHVDVVVVGPPGSSASASVPTGAVDVGEAGVLPDGRHLWWLRVPLAGLDQAASGQIAVVVTRSDGTRAELRSPVIASEEPGQYVVSAVMERVPG